MPDGSAVICQALSPLDALDPRLAGCTWKVLGREVPLTDDLPDYYFLRFSGDGVPSRQVQIWLWQVLPRDPPAYVEYRWRPDADDFVDFVHLPCAPRGHLAAVKRLSALLNLSLHHNRLGRPSEAAYVVDAAHLERRLISTFQQLEKHGQPATRSRVAKALSWSRGTLKNYCDRFDTDFDTVRQRVRDGQAP